jgi:hypothetical protein
MSPCGTPELRRIAAAAMGEDDAAGSPEALWGGAAGSEGDQLTALAAGPPSAFAHAAGHPHLPLQAHFSQPPYHQQLQQLAPPFARAPGKALTACVAAPEATAATSSFLDEYEALSDDQLEELAWETASRLNEIHAALYMRDTRRRAAAAAAGAAAAGAGCALLAGAPAAKRARSL